MERTGIFVGSFDPFTIGHDSVVKRAVKMFDKLVISVGINENKRYMQTADERVEAIRHLYKDDNRISVEKYSGLTAEFARQMSAEFIVKYYFPKSEYYPIW